MNTVQHVQGTNHKRGTWKAETPFWSVLKRRRNEGALILLKVTEDFPSSFVPIHTRITAHKWQEFSRLVVFVELNLFAIDSRSAGAWRK